jgi:hypothetical protein
MEAIQSNKGLTAARYGSIVFPIALFLSVYLLGDFAIRGRLDTPNACHLARVIPPPGRCQWLPIPKDLPPRTS